MTKLDKLLIENNRLKEKVIEAKENLLLNNISITPIIEKIFEEYESVFSPLNKYAKTLNVQLDEIFKDEEFGRFGNSVIVNISYNQKGFAIIKTKDCFRNETDYFEAFIPKKYLTENAIELINTEGSIINAELKRIELNQKLNKSKSTNTIKLKI